jgi:hypothetical protein
MKPESIAQGLYTSSHHEKLMRKDTAVMISQLVRLSVYLLLTAGVIEFLLKLASQSNYPDPFEEGQLVECSQVVVMACTSLLLAMAAWKHRPSHHFMSVMTAVSFIAVVREMDSLLDRLIPTGGWQIVALPFGLWAFWKLITHWHKVWSQGGRWLCTPAAGLIWCGLVTVIAFAQILGQAHIWQDLLGQEYTRHIKRVVEETSESFGYLLLLYGGIETLIWAWRQNPPAPVSSHEK